MSIYNMIASIVGGGGGGGTEMEQGTFTVDASYFEVFFTDTHTAAPDIVLVSPVDSTQMSNANAVAVMINGTGNLDIDLAGYNMSENIRGLVGLLDGGYYNGYGYGSLIPATSAQILGTMTSTGFWVQNLENGIDYNWWAIWANGSGGGGGGGTVNLQAKTHIGASTSSQTISADAGYDGLSSVQIDPVSQTNLLAGNIKSGTTVSISNGTSNLWSVTGTYSGGSSKNVQTNQTTSRTSSTSLTSVNSLTCSTAGTYDVYWTCDRSSTSGTWSSQLYLGGTAYGSEQTSWSNHVQTVHLSNVSISANQTVAVYVKARGTNYYGYAPQLTIIQS